jgi:hypothetical protein
MENALPAALSLNCDAFQPAHGKPGAWIKSASAPTALERSHPGACIAELLESAASGDRGKVSGRDPAREVRDCRAQMTVRFRKTGQGAMPTQQLLSLLGAQGLEANLEIETAQRGRVDALQEIGRCHC